MQRLETRLDGPILLAPNVHGDQRGFFLETYRKNAYVDCGIADEFVQDNQSRSGHAVVRGMHFQPGMAKLVRVAHGAILDVLVDLRKGSPTFGEWESFRLDDDDHHQLYCPDGFAHGFCVLSAVADLVYKCSDYWNPSSEEAFAHDDADVGIRWPDLDLVVSERDAHAPRFREVAETLAFTYGP